MIILIDTATPTLYLTVDHNGRRQEFEWELGRQLSKEILPRLEEAIAAAGSSWEQIQGIGIFEGPGSFTGLRIGITVGNAVALGRNIPVVGSRGDTWKEMAVGRLLAGDNDHIVLPYYGAEAHITAPRK